MRLGTQMIALLVVLGSVTTATAQFPAAAAEHAILKLEEGDWDAEVTMFMGPAGAFDPPHKSKGKESNRMLGDFWIVCDYTGEFEGLPFTGRGQFGYNSAKGKYVGTWVDSFSPNVTKMVGDYDADKKTMTYTTLGTGMDGKPSKGKNVVVYGKDKRTMTMYTAAPGTDDLIKVMEIVYTRSK